MVIFQFALVKICCFSLPYLMTAQVVFFCLFFFYYCFTCELFPDSFMANKMSNSEILHTTNKQKMSTQHFLFYFMNKSLKETLVYCEAAS